MNYQIELMRRKHKRPATDTLGFHEMELTIERKVAGQPEIIAIANSAAIDLQQEVVVPSGADTSYFFGKRTIYLNHNYDWPIGSLRSATLKNGQWLCRFAFASTPQAQEVSTLVAEGIVRGVSIGFVATDYGAPTADEAKTYGPMRSIVRKWLWLELSVTPMPCNPEAVIQLVKEKRIKHTTAAMLGVRLPRIMPQRYLIV